MHRVSRGIPMCRTVHDKTFKYGVTQRYSDKSVERSPDYFERRRLHEEVLKISCL